MRSTHIQSVQRRKVGQLLRKGEAGGGNCRRPVKLAVQATPRKWLGGGWGGVLFGGVVQLRGRCLWGPVNPIGQGTRGLLALGRDPA